MPTDADLMFVFSMFIGALIYAVFTTVIMILMMMFSPGWQFVRSRLKKQPLIAAFRRDRKIDFHRCDKYIEGLATSKKYKSAYIIDPNSVYVDQKSGVSVLPVNLEFGITLSPDILQAFEGLKSMGFDNIEEAEAYNALYGACSCGYNGLMIPVWKTGPDGAMIEEIDRLKCPRSI